MRLFAMPRSRGCIPGEIDASALAVYSPRMSRRVEPRLRTASTDSPCVQVCELHPDGSHCVGCFRTREEIAQWIRYSAAEREEVLVRLEQRRAARRAQLHAQRLERNGGA